MPHGGAAVPALCASRPSRRKWHMREVPASRMHTRHMGRDVDLAAGTIPGTVGVPLHSSGTHDLVDAHGRAATLEFDVHHAPHAVNLRHHPGVVESAACSTHDGNVTLWLRHPLGALAQALIHRLTSKPGTPSP